MLGLGRWDDEAEIKKVCCFFLFTKRRPFFSSGGLIGFPLIRCRVSLRRRKQSATRNQAGGYEISPRDFSSFFPIAAFAQPTTVPPPDAVAQAAAEFFIDGCILHAATFDQFQQWGKKNHLVHPTHVSHGFEAGKIFVNPSHLGAMFVSPGNCFVNVPRADNRHLAEYLLHDLTEMHARVSPMWHTAQLGQNFYTAGESVYVGRKMFDLYMTGGDGNELPDAVPEVSGIGISASLDPASKT